MTIWPRDSPFATAKAVATADDHEMSTWIFAIALACGAWYVFILVVQTIGFTQLYVNAHPWRDHYSDTLPDIDITRLSRSLPFLRL
jgi:hypothetical protein